MQFDQLNRREFITLLAARNSNCYCFRSFGFEFQEPCSAFTSWRARKRDPKTFSLPAHNQELVLGHVTFVLQQLFQISLEREFCFNHRIERLLHRGRQIICIDVLPLQILPVPLSCTECLDQTESVVSSANWPPSFLWE